MAVANAEPKVTNHPAEEQVLNEQVELIYDEQDKEYIKFVQDRLAKAQRMNDQVHPEFNNKTRHQYYDENLKIANTHHLEKKRNPDDVIVSSGTIEQKLDSLLSHVNNLNLESEVLAFDRDNNKLVELGMAMADIIHDTKIREPESDGAGDEEKRIARQREMLVQGTVFVQENWTVKWQEHKKLTNKNWKGEFKGVDWTKKLEKAFEGPNKVQLYGPNVYLGDINEFSMEDQPFIFVLKHMSYDAARKIYGTWENWKHVKKGKLPATVSKEGQSIFENKWRLTDLQEDQVEIVFYQDKGRDEFQIIINGVFMMPMMFPLSAVSPGGEYNIVKQVFRVFHKHFALGKSFVSSGSVKEISDLIDEMIKLFVLKTRMSVTPPYVNTSGRVIDRKVLSPGRISMGFDPQSLTPITQNAVQGVTAGEAAMLEKFESYLDESTVSNQFTGQANNGSQTATETIELQQQAQKTLSLTIASASLLEKKLDYLRLLNVLENWFEPIGKKAVGPAEARRTIREFRTVNRDVSIDGEGPGERKIIPVEGDLPEADVIRELELNEQKERGIPVQKIFLNPTEIKRAKLLWYIVVLPKEKEGSPLFKLLFREQLNDMLTLIQLGSIPNLEGLEEDLSKTWGKKRDKLFKSQPSQPQPGQEGGEEARTPEQQSQAAGRSGGSALPIGALAGVGAGEGGGGE